MIDPTIRMVRKEHGNLREDDGQHCRRHDLPPGVADEDETGEHARDGERGRDELRPVEP